MRRLLPELPGIAWVYLATRIPPAFGNGLALPFVLIYLHDVRGISLGTAGLLWGGRILVMIVGSFASGPLIDRYGPVGVSLVGLTLMATGWATLAFAASVGFVLVSTLIAGVGAGLNMPTSSVIVGRVAVPRIRHTVFSLQVGVFNLGIACGAAVAGAIAHSSRPETYTLLFLLTAAMSVPTAAFNTYVGLSRGVAAPRKERAERGPGGYLALLSQPLVARLILASLAYFLAGEAIWTVGIGPYMKSFAGFPESRIGLLFTANTIAVFCFQFLVARWIEGRPRLRVLGTGFVAWGFAFLVLITVTRLLHGTQLFLALVALAVAVAAAECTLPPIVEPLLLELVPDGLQGRAMALVTKGQTIGMASGTMVVGLLLALSADALWIAAALLLFATGAMLLTTAVPAEHRLVPVSSE
jgi:MFS family permease